MVPHAQVHAVAAALFGVDQVDFAAHPETIQIALGEEAGHQVLEVLVGDVIGLEAGDLAVHLEDHPLSDAQVEIGAPQLHHPLQQLLDADLVLSHLDER
jgi:hypothetical protein